jgi:hypothetical protein
MRRSKEIRIGDGYAQLNERSSFFFKAKTPYLSRMIGSIKLRGICGYIRVCERCERAKE